MSCHRKILSSVKIVCPISYLPITHIAPIKKMKLHVCNINVASFNQPSECYPKSKLLQIPPRMRHIGWPSKSGHFLGHKKMEKKHSTFKSRYLLFIYLVEWFITKIYFDFSGIKNSKKKKKLQYSFPISIFFAQYQYFI